jgi:hypothetical protein
MGIFGHRRAGGVAERIAEQSALGAEGGWLTAGVSSIALLFSVYSVYETSLRRPDLRVFVPPVIQYASPYQNSNFEVFEIPLTITNVGARSGAILSFELEVTNPRRKETKHFYAAEIGRWTMTNAKAGNFRRFTPLALPGKSSLSDSLLFYPPREEKVLQIADQKGGSYQFRLSMRTAVPEDLGLIDRLWTRPPEPVVFEMEMPEIDFRTFEESTQPLNSKDYRPSQSGGG